MINTEWRNAITTPPQKDGEYLVYNKSNCYDVVSYSLNLYRVNRYDFYNKKGCPGWYEYDSEYGYYESNVDYWMELPKPPIP